MAYRQPRPPEYRGDAPGYSRALILFLKDFATAAWAANNRRIREIEALDRRMTALEALRTEDMKWAE